jgi:hypothetical protein
MNCENCNYDMGDSFENCGASEDGVCPECSNQCTPPVTNKMKAEYYYVQTNDEPLGVFLFENRDDIPKTSQYVRTTTENPTDLVPVDNYPRALTFRECL